MQKRVRFWCISGPKQPRDIGDTTEGVSALLQWRQQANHKTSRSEKAALKRILLPELKMLTLPCYVNKNHLSLFVKVEGSQIVNIRDLHTQKTTLTGHYLAGGLYLAGFAENVFVPN